MNYKKIIASHEYDFLRQNEHLKDSLILLGLSGSHAYGTNVEDSGFDIRGIYRSNKEQVEDVYGKGIKNKDSAGSFALRFEFCGFI